jgi:hypothetical protein
MVANMVGSNLRRIQGEESYEDLIWKSRVGQDALFEKL